LAEKGVGSLEFREGRTLFRPRFRGAKKWGLPVGKPLLIGLTSRFFFDSLRIPHGPVVVAVVAVRVMEVTVDQVVDVVAVGDGR
jgi:hypothetical protein